MKDNNVENDVKTEAPITVYQDDVFTLFDLLVSGTTYDTYKNTDITKKITRLLNVAENII